MQPSKFVVGTCYELMEIQRYFGGQPQSYLPSKDGIITCGLFRVDMNPDAPEVVVVGEGPDNNKHAEWMAKQKSVIPVFLKHASNQWEFVGLYRLKEFSRRHEDVELHGKRAGRTVTGVLFFTKWNEK